MMERWRLGTRRTRVLGFIARLFKAEELIVVRVQQQRVRRQLSFVTLTHCSMFAVPSSSFPTWKVKLINFQFDFHNIWRHKKFPTLRTRKLSLTWYFRPNPYRSVGQLNLGDVLPEDNLHRGVASFLINVKTSQLRGQSEVKADTI